MGPCLEDWAHEGSCIDQCKDEVWHGDEPPAQVLPTYLLGQHPHGGFARPQEGSLRTARPASHPCGDGAPLRVQEPWTPQFVQPPHGSGVRRPPPTTSQPHGDSVRSSASVSDTVSLARAARWMSSRSMSARITSRGPAKSSHVAWMCPIAASKKFGACPQESSQWTARPASQPRVEGTPRQARAPWML